MDYISANDTAINIFQIPKSYSLQAAGPIFCSGITMYTPLKQWGALKGGMNVGVVGIGGLGQVDLYILCSPNTSGRWLRERDYSSRNF